MNIKKNGRIANIKFCKILVVISFEDVSKKIINKKPNT